MIKYFLSVCCILFLLGCGAGQFRVAKPDGTVVSGCWVHVISDPTITGAKIATTQGTSVQLDGFHAESKMTAADLLRAAAVLSGH